MSRHAQKLRDHDINPCVEETDASRKCMDDNNYKKDMCTAYFLKYKNCRKFWTLSVLAVPGMFPPELPSDISSNKFISSVLNGYLGRNSEHDIMMQRKRNGVKPEMPSAEERRKILESMGKPY